MNSPNVLEKNSSISAIYCRKRQRIGMENEQLRFIRQRQLKWYSGPCSINRRPVSTVGKHPDAFHHDGVTTSDRTRRPKLVAQPAPNPQRWRRCRCSFSMGHLRSRSSATSSAMPQSVSGTSFARRRVCLFHQSPDGKLLMGFLSWLFGFGLRTFEHESCRCGLTNEFQPFSPGDVSMDVAHQMSPPSGTVSFPDWNWLWQVSPSDIPSAWPAPSRVSSCLLVHRSKHHCACNPPSKSKSSTTSRFSGTEWEKKIRWLLQSLFVVGWSDTANGRVMKWWCQASTEAVKATTITTSVAV